MDEEKGKDDVDIWFFKKSKEKLTETKVEAEPLEPVSLSGDIDSDAYFMKLPNKGKCYIFNHKEFKKLDERKGTDLDAQRLYCQFRKLGFEDVKIFNSWKVKDVMAKLKEVGEEDHSNNSCFVCCILTHGEYGYLHAKDGKYPTKDVFALFLPKHCPTLGGKPKIFFIQACQGDKTDSGVKVICSESVDTRKIIKIPTYADFFIMYSTVPGLCAWRNESKGSWFIQSLCDVLEEHAETKDLLSMSTIVNRRVALDYQSYNHKDVSKHKKKQVPLIYSTLTRDLKFLLI